VDARADIIPCPSGGRLWATTTSHQAHMLERQGPGPLWRVSMKPGKPLTYTDTARALSASSSSLAFLVAPSACLAGACIERISIKWLRPWHLMDASLP
jgi:hypothetical protein